MSADTLLSRISLDLLMPIGDVEYIVKTAPKRYKVFQIPKRKAGEFRTIAQPAFEVKQLQYWVMENVLGRFPIHRAATAYRKGANIKENAATHANHAFLLKLDFRDFFNSIRSIDFLDYLERGESELSIDDRASLVKILFWKPKWREDLILSIGAPSSPMLSNILMFDFDTRVDALCREASVTYTRYADDMTFSTNQREVLRDILGSVDTIRRGLRSPNLRLNPGKTVHASRKNRRYVTGLILANQGNVSLGRNRKKRIRAAVHKFSLGVLDDQRVSSLRGMLAFVNAVEPAFLERLRRKYTNAVLATLGFPG